MCAVLACCQQNQTWFQSKYNSYCKYKDKVCCRLYHKRKGLFLVLCFLTPFVIVIYFIFILLFITYVVGSLFISVLCFHLCEDIQNIFSCVFKWPCRLCNNESCTGHTIYQKSDYCMIHVICAIFIVFPVFGMVLLCVSAVSLFGNRHCLLS